MTTQPTISKQSKTYPKKKRLMYQELQELPKNYSVIALTNINKVRATQLMAIRKKFRNEIKIRIIKNKITQRAFEKIKDVPGLEKLSEELKGQCALMFTNINPFKLNLLFDQNKIFLPAKGGDIVTKEIVIPAGNTGISPGPVLSEFKESNVLTRIDQGMIWVSKDAVVAKPGDVIPQKLASLMSKLDIKPIEAGITVSHAVSEGVLFKEQELTIDLSKYRSDLQKSIRESLALALEAGYITAETISLLLVRAHSYAMFVAQTSAYVSKDTAPIVLNMATNQANTLAKILQNNGYSAE
jgi:large subunit ribosomal protein L10